jgi:hypothetical protein
MSTPVTVENFVRAESHMYFGHSVAEDSIGVLHHIREPMPIDHQTVVRANRDTLYSSGLFDLDARPVTLTMADAGHRFMSLQVFDEDEYVIEVADSSGPHTYSREQAAGEKIDFDAFKVSRRYEAA